jgi:hypothetical protein
MDRRKGSKYTFYVALSETRPNSAEAARIRD